MKEFTASPDDVEFRLELRRLLDQAKYTVSVIAGELGAYDFPEIREGVLDASRRGVALSFYANEPKFGTTRELRLAGASVSLGELRSRHHYFVSDHLHVIESLKEPTQRGTVPGTRQGFFRTDDPEFARAAETYFDFLRNSESGRHSAEAIESLLESARVQPLLLRRIPVWQNALELAGESDATIQPSFAEARNRLPEWAGRLVTDLPDDDLQTAVLNLAGLVTAFAFARSNEAVLGVGWASDASTRPSGSSTQGVPGVEETEKQLGSDVTGGPSSADSE